MQAKVEMVINWLCAENQKKRRKNTSLKYSHKAKNKLSSLHKNV